ncbi:MAG TPA: dihydrolipoamide acetyltransferase family protein [Acidimicrobiales bacterium]|nr:dihydrolipoamide acetyltransferase family protein [Acidimicrobiales bacterium]
MGQFKMPSLGADMESGTLTRWLVGPGDQVHRGDVVAVVDTEKSTLEVEVFETGVVDRLLVAEGAEVPVGTPLAVIGAAVGGPVPPAPPAPAPPAPAAAAPAPPAAAPPAPAAAGVAIGPAIPTSTRPALVASPMVRRLAGRLGVDLALVRGSAPGGRITRHDVEAAAGRPPGAPARPFIRSSPRARRLAAERGLDLAAVAGTGPGGAVTVLDVECAGPAAPPPAPAVPAGTGPAVAATQLTGAASQMTGATTRTTGAAPAAGPVEDRQAAMRRAIGALMARSKREVPHYYLSTTADMGPAADWLTRTNLDRPVASRLIMPALLLKAVARAVATVPEMNGSMVDGSFVPAPAVHLGVAISLRGGGLIAPAIHDADRLALGDLMGALRDLVSRARAGRLRSSEMSDPTITVTNLGDLGVESVFGVIYPPQVALVGFGRVAERPWAENGMLGVRPCTTVTLSADHRASDGHRGGLFLTQIAELLRKPEEL